MIREDSPDVVILDIRMEGMDGHQALQKIKEISPGTQVIMLTGHGTPDSATRALVDAAFDYLNKPCDIDILAVKVHEACQARRKKAKRPEKKARDIMIPIDDYTTVSVNSTVQEAVERLMDSFQKMVAGSRVMETGHRSLLVFDERNALAGILSIHDLIRGVRPSYLADPKSSVSDAIRYSPMFWGGWYGLFSSQVEALAGRKVGELMSEAPPMVDGDANLMEVADLLFKTGKRRVVVTSGTKVVGILREQDLFFEMTKIIIDWKGTKQ
jgi:CBS domain-containing protein